MTPIGDGTGDPARILRDLFDAAVASAQPDVCVPPNLPDPPRGRTVVVGVGKAAAKMARAVEAYYPAPVGGVIVCPYGAALPLRYIRVIEAAHPIADANSVRGAAAICDAVSGLTADDLVIALISGGGSALAALPVDGVTLAEKQEAVAALMRAGAPIRELNALRAALSRFKGGGLLRALPPARCVSLIISDVVGDDPAVIASGPTVPAAPDPAAVLASLERHGVRAAPAVAAHLRAVAAHAGPVPAGSADNRLIATPGMALAASAARARAVGLEPRILGDAIEGDPATAARVHLDAAASLRPGELLISGGELTTAVRGEGKGGPNLEFCLELAVRGMGDGLWALAADTDGRDGNSGVAGAVLAPDGAARARAMGIDPEALLRRSAALEFFAALDALVDPGWTGTNVNDFRVLLKT